MNPFPEIKDENDLKAALLVLTMLLPPERLDVIGHLLGRVLSFTRRHAVETYKREAAK